MDKSQKPQIQKFVLFVLIVLIAIAGLAFLFSSDNTKQAKPVSQQQEATNAATMKQYPQEPKMMIDEKKKYTATVTTTQGAFQVDLFADETPRTVNNFVFLAKEGFYNGTVFHRIIKDFMIQGGDPKGDGTGGPGYKFEDEKITRDYKKGIIAMANSGPNTNGSQFFVMHKDTPLPKQYVIFGTVTQGIETIDKIADIPTVDNGRGENSKPTVEVKIEKIEIAEK